MNEGAAISLELNQAEFEFVRTALRLLLSTLGHEEAEELHEVRALLARLDTIRASA